MPDTNEPTADAADPALDALLQLVKAANSPDILEAQTILLRRLALQGDVIPSRVPAPRNISEIGGYLNLLADLNQPETRAQMLAGILGVAGPNPPLGFTPSAPPLSFIPFANDRPPGAAQPAIPLTFAIRADFATAMQAALKTLHDQGATLPLLTALPSLPPAISGTAPPADMLAAIGRVLTVVPAAALRDADTDPIALARPQGGTAAFEVMSRSSTGGPPAQPWDAVECTDTACATVQVTASFVAVAPILASAGFYPASPLPQPTALASVSWARFTNVTGLVTGVTRLGDELSLLYGSAALMASAFASRLSFLWNGTDFVAP